MIANSQGFVKERFPEVTGDSFDCGICYLVCREPKECIKCGSMYCSGCINDWLVKHNECPIGCSEAKANVRPITGALSKIYRNLNIRCKYPECNQVVKVCELEQHELNCQLPKCEFFEQCNNRVKPGSKDGVCDLVCQFMKKIRDSNGSWGEIYGELKNLDKLPKAVSSVVGSGPVNTGALDKFRWDKARMGQGITVSNNDKSVLLKENAYMFRTAISDVPMMNGIHYWEIHADPTTENELKIGITTRRDFNYNTAFCDYEFGYAYYGLGQLRHNSNSLGGAYGKKFKKTGALGCCLDMNKGTLSFALDGEYWGEAYRSEALKKGPVYVAVALLHQAGCVLETEKPVPNYFLKN